MIHDSELAQRLIGVIKEQQTDLSRSAMMHPKETDFLRGVQAGEYQGLEKALNNLLDILDDAFEQEKRK